MMASAVLAHTQILILNKPREYPNNTYRLKKNRTTQDSTGLSHRFKSPIPTAFLRKEKHF